jgi:hypothetical protein
MIVCPPHPDVGRQAVTASMLLPPRLPVQSHICTSLEGDVHVKIVFTPPLCIGRVGL